MIATDRFVLHEVHHHPGPYRGRTAIMRRLASDGLVVATADGWKLTAKGVGEVTDEDIQQIKRLQDGLVAAIAERDALQALVAEQCEALAEMVPTPTEEVDRLQEVEADFIRLREAVAGHFLNMFGTRQPSSLDCRSAGIDASDLIAEMGRYEP